MSLIASETENMQVKINLSDKQSKNGDEEFEGMSVSDIPEFTDPAILAVREITRVRYTKEELINLRNVPLSKKKPDFLESTEGLPWILGTERWPFDRKKSGSGEPSDNSGNSSGSGAADHRRRNSGDPRERIRKENDGIVLSPQRRSFNSGCFVPASRAEPAARNHRPHSPLGSKNDSTYIGIRENQPNTRRIGSGRILRANGDFNEKSETSEGDNYGNNFRGPRGPNNNNDEKYERRSFSRDFDVGRDRENNNKDGRRNGRGYDRRKISENKEQDEPEWFSSGPMSQNDTIELRGFDDADKPGKKKISPSQVKRAKEWSKKKEAIQNVTTHEKDEEKASIERSGNSEAQIVVEVPDTGETKKDTENLKESETKNKRGDAEPNSKRPSVLSDQSLNFDDILKCDTIPGLLSNIEIECDGNTSKSRFSRWFKQDSPEKQESRKSSLPDDSLIKNLLNDIGETNLITNTIPGDSDAYFAPISPAANHLGTIVDNGKREATNQMKRPVNLMEMLQMNNHHVGLQNVKQQPMVGKILSLDELEAKIRKNADAAGVPQKPPSKPDEEMSAAFKKLLSQAQAGPMNKTQPMSLLEMLKDSQQQDEAARLSASAAHIIGPASPNILHHHHNSHQAHMPNEMALQLQQAQLKQQQKQQMEMFNKLINSTSISSHPMRTSPSLHDIGIQQQTRELLNRPEAQAILQGLKRGEITIQHLYQQLANPALQHRHREMLLTILKIQNTSSSTTPGYGPSPRVSPVPPHHHHIFQQQQQQPQQLRVSPLPPNAMHQRIPSPRELQVHTQNILQRALIKKKLEEQQENYRKKQEMAFTPTSVLRKMTAEKDESKENKTTAEKIQAGRPLTGIRPQPSQPQGNPQWYGNLKQPGRPIVKANNYQTQTPEQFFSQHQQQQHQRIFNQLQQQQLSSQLHQRKPSTNNQFGSTSQPPTSSGGHQFNQSSQYHLTNQQFGQQLTQQQLRAQHQHRPSNSQNTTQHHQQQGSNMWQQILNNAQQQQRSNRNSNLSSGRSENNDPSPTTNQLAQWFSPDLLERARGGELPSTAGLAQHVISLEEIERQTAPPVHN